MAVQSTVTSSDRSLFDNKFLSDITIKFSGQQLSCHKVILARKSEYFYRAFSSQFSVASSNEVDLGDDEDSEAIRAMIRHMYDLPYDQMLVDNTVDDSAAYSTNKDLILHIGVFTTADKYDIASLRPLVVKKFESLMESNWESDSFATCIQKLTGPSAGHVADKSLQAAAAAFCAKNLPQLVKKDAFVKMIHEEEPFTGRLLTGFLNNGQGATTVQLKVCHGYDCSYAEPSKDSLYGLESVCVVCGSRLDSGYPSVEYKKAVLL